MPKILSSLLAFLLVATAAWAQGGGGGGGGGNNGGGNNGGGNNGGGNNNSGGGKNLPGRGEPETEPATWVSSLQAAIESATTNDRYILVYFHSPKLKGEPTEFGVKDLIDASTTSFVFYRKAYDKEDPDVQKLKVRGAPTLIGMDKFGNEFKRIERISTSDIRAMIKLVPELVKKFLEKLKSDFAKAKDVKGYLAIALLPHVGYKEIDEARAWIEKAGKERLAQIEALDAKEQEAALKAMMAEFKGAAPADSAELRLARLEAKRGQIAAAIARYKRLEKSSESEAAAKELEELVAEGLQRVDQAKRLVGTGDAAGAKEALRRIQEDYKGTEAARKAAEALKTLE